MKKISTLFLIILCLCLAFALASCSEHTHNFSADEGTVITEPTCMYEGKLVRTCECGKTKVEKLDKLSHSYSETVSYDNAYHYYVCTNEKCTSAKDVVAHTWVIDATKTVAASCKSIGSETYNCSCGAQKTVNIPQIREHVWDAGVDTPATCIATGVKTFTCTICAEIRTEELPMSTVHVFDEKYTVDETNHYFACKTPGCTMIKEDSVEEHVWDSGKVEASPTCLEVGSVTYTCTKCETTKTEEIPVAAHEFSVEYRGNDLYHYHYCINPDCTAIDEKTAHTWGIGIITKIPTPVVPGERVYTCDVCGGSKTEAIEYHSYEWNYDETDHYLKCTVDGHTDVTLKEKHNFDEGFITREPTESAFGEAVYTCHACGYRQKRPVYITNRPDGALTANEWEEVFSENFDNFTVKGKWYTDDKNYVEYTVKVLGKIACVSFSGGELYYYDGADADLVYIYDAETATWSNAVTEKAYASQYFYNLLCADGMFLDFIFEPDIKSYYNYNVTLGETSYDNIRYSFSDGKIARVTADFKDAVSFNGKSFVAMDIEFSDYGETDVLSATEFFKNVEIKSTLSEDYTTLYTTELNCSSSVISYTTYGFNLTTYDGDNRYVNHYSYDDLTGTLIDKVIWYVDGICYANIGGVKTQEAMSLADFEAFAGIEPRNEESAVSVMQDEWFLNKLEFSSITFDGIYYVLTIPINAVDDFEFFAEFAVSEGVVGTMEFYITQDLQLAAYSILIDNQYCGEHDGYDMIFSSYIEIGFNEASIVAPEDAYNYEKQ